MGVTVLTGSFLDIGAGFDVGVWFTGGSIPSVKVVSEWGKSWEIIPVLLAGVLTI